MRNQSNKMSWRIYLNMRNLSKYSAILILNYHFHKLQPKTQSKSLQEPHHSLLYQELNIKLLIKVMVNIYMYISYQQVKVRNNTLKAIRKYFSAKNNSNSQYNWDLNMIKIKILMLEIYLWIMSHFIGMMTQEIQNLKRIRSQRQTFRWNKYSNSLILLQ